jgi:hypothetical protein
LVAAGLLVAGLVVAGCGDSASSTARGEPQGRRAQFVVECALSHVAFDDPIVLPGQPGASHQHQFFGNSMVDSTPDYDRVSGAPTTCEQRLDTASYWAPVLLDETGARVEPVGMTAYYRPGRGIDPATVEPYPAGLMMVGGDAHARATQSTDVVAWSCGSGAVRTAEPPACGGGTTLRMIVTFPDCWNGIDLTSDDIGHEPELDHVVYSDGGCPETHPVPVPELELTIDFPPVDPAGLSLASGSIRTGHADFWNVWDQDKLADEVANCLNRDLTCGVSG